MSIVWCVCWSSEHNNLAFISHCSERANRARTLKFERAQQWNSKPSKIYFAWFFNGFSFFIELPYNMSIFSLLFERSKRENTHIEYSVKITEKV